MKKFLSFLGSVSLISSMTTTVIACANNDANFHRNPDYVGQEIKQSVETKELIVQSIEARIKAAILTDTYSINGEQTKENVFHNLSKSNTDLSKFYATYFEETDFDSTKNAGIDSNIDLSGNRGYPGGILDLIQLPAILETLLKTFFKIDFHSSSFKNQMIDILNLIGGVLPGFDMTRLVSEIPDLLKKIPNDLLDVIPKFLQDGIPEAIQAAINTFLKRETFNLVFQGLVQGSDLTRFEDLTISQLFDAFFVNLTNFVGFAIDDNFTKISDTDEINFDQLGTFWFNHQSNLEQFNFERNLSQTIEQFVSLLGIFNLILSVYKTPNVSYADNQHLFSNTQTNEEFILELQNKTIKELLDPKFNFQSFQIGSLFSNLVYYFGSGQHEQLRFNKFLYVWLFNGDQSNLPAFWKFSFALIKADETSENSKVAKGISEKLNDLYLQTISPKFLQPILNNEKINPISREENQTYWEIIDQKIAPGIEPFFESIIVTLATKPMDVIYQGDLSPIIAATSELAGEQWTQKIQTKINEVLNHQDLNVQNLLNVSLAKILGLAKTPNFPTNDQGLIPDYAGYYTNKSLRGLVDELGQTFEMNGLEAQQNLIYYTFDFSILKNFMEYLLYDNQIVDNQGLIADFFAGLINKTSLISILGYVDNHLDQVWQESALGQLMLFMVPELADTDEWDYYSLTDLEGKQDNFRWVVNGIMSILTNAMEPTNYVDFINQILAIENGFNIEKKIEEFSKSGNIRSGEYIIKYNLEAVNAVLGYPKTNKKTITYRLSFATTNESDKYRIKTFRKTISQLDLKGK